MSRFGNVWDNAAMESFFSSLKTERVGRKTYRTRDEAKADVFDYIERFYNPKRRHSTIGYVSPMEFERHLSRCQQNRVQLRQQPILNDNIPFDAFRVAGFLGQFPAGARMVFM